MPIHDWSRVEAAIFHDFRHGWIGEISRALNRGAAPSDHYALIEPFAAGLGPEILTLPVPAPDGDGESSRGDLLARHGPPTIVQDEMELSRRRQNVIAVRQAGDDRIVAAIAVLSPANKFTPHAIDRFVRKVADLLERRVHLLILDLIPPGRHDPRGIHGAIWDYIDSREYSPPPGKPLTLAAYEADLVTRAYVEPVAVGDVLPEMPLFLEPDGCVEVPLEETYRAAWEAVPWRWKDVLEPSR